MTFTGQYRPLARRRTLSSADTDPWSPTRHPPSSPTPALFTTRSSVIPGKTSSTRRSKPTSRRGRSTCRTRDFQFMSARELDGVQDVIGVGTPSNQCGPSLRVGVPKIDAASCLITGVRRENESAFHPYAKLRESTRIDLAAVRNLKRTASCRQRKCPCCSERPLDELATVVTGMEMHCRTSSRRRVVLDRILHAEYAGARRRRQRFITSEAAPQTGTRALHSTV